MKLFAHKIRQNLAILFAAIVCALVIFFIVKNPGLFQASILSLEEKAFMNEKRRDVAYKTSNGALEIFVAEKHKYHTENFQGIVYFNPDEIVFDTTTLTGQGTFKITETTADSLVITITTPDKIDTNEEIIAIPFSGDAKNIVLGESRGKNKGGWTNFAIGNLNEFVQHGE